MVSLSDAAVAEEIIRNRFIEWDPMRGAEVGLDFHALEWN
jgi:hypothetical protein